MPVSLTNTPCTKNILVNFYDRVNVLFTPPPMVHPVYAGDQRRFHSVTNLGFA